MRARGGFSLAELAAVMAITSILAGLLLGILVAQQRLAREAARRVAAADAVRVSAHVLAGEAARMTPRDVRAVAPDSLAVRAFRGTATPCDESTGELVVRYGGDRAPNPGKDSVLVISPGAPERAVALTASRAALSSGCAPREGEVPMVWQLEPSTPAPSLLLLFESGVYYLAGGALRYRLGAEGRQPVSAELLVHPSTRFDSLADARLRLTLATDSSRIQHLSLPFGGTIR
jgi:prepilin-type N-terminal cleavage/methylation domain-containing protein